MVLWMVAWLHEEAPVHGPLDGGVAPRGGSRAWTAKSWLRTRNAQYPERATPSRPRAAPPTVPTCPEPFGASMTGKAVNRTP